MPRCRNCQREISKFDKDICPYCGENNPIDPTYETIDVTSYIDPQGQGYELYRSKSRKSAALLCLTLGFLGIHNFYLGFKKRGIIECAISILFIAGVGSALFFSGLLANALAFVLPFLAVWLLYGLWSIQYFKKDNLKDGHGEFLR